MKKLYLVERTDNIGYEEYDSFVLIAENEEEILSLIKMYGVDCYQLGLFIDDEDYEKMTILHNITIKEINIQDEEKGVLLASYNPG